MTEGGERDGASEATGSEGREEGREGAGGRGRGAQSQPRPAEQDESFNRPACLSRPDCIQLSFHLCAPLPSRCVPSPSPSLALQHQARRLGLDRARAGRRVFFGECRRGPRGGGSARRASAGGRERRRTYFFFSPFIFPGSSVLVEKDEREESVRGRGRGRASARDGEGMRGGAGTRISSSSLQAYSLQDKGGRTGWSACPSSCSPSPSERASDEVVRREGDDQSASVRQRARSQRAQETEERASGWGQAAAGRQGSQLDGEGCQRGAVRPLTARTAAACEAVRIVVEGERDRSTAAAAHARATVPSRRSSRCPLRWSVPSPCVPCPPAPPST